MHFNNATHTLCTTRGFRYKCQKLKIGKSKARDIFAACTSHQISKTQKISMDFVRNLPRKTITKLILILGQNDPVCCSS